ncbi:hypothetical protein D3C78_1151680 [compost metagenome]
MPPSNVKPNGPTLNGVPSAVGTLGALTTCHDAGFAVFVMLGATFAAVMLAMTDDGVLTQFAGAVGAGAGVSLLGFHRSDSSIRVAVRAWHQSHTSSNDRAP